MLGKSLNCLHFVRLSALVDYAVPAVGLCCAVAGTIFGVERRYLLRFSKLFVPLSPQTISLTFSNCMVCCDDNKQQYI